MANPSPLDEHFEEAGAVFLSFGEGVRLASEIEGAEVEYAAVRKAAGLMDCPNRGLLRLTGGDRLDFLHRLLSGNCNAMGPGEVRRMFLLTAKGRLIADLLVVHREEETLIDVDCHQAATVAEELDKLLFAEDLQIEDRTASLHRLSLHGPAAEDVAGWLGEQWGADAVARRFRYDEAGELGLHLWVEPDVAGRVAKVRGPLNERFGVKPLGWLAYNTARIEAGTVLFNVDYGPDSLPHEAGPDRVHEAVDFESGCYRGQEIVARMESLGHPAKRLVAFRVEGEGSDVVGLPVAGSAITASKATDAETVGAVTSSTHSPMLSNAPIGFAMVAWAQHEPGTELFAPAGGGTVPIRVQEQMAFWQKERGGNSGGESGGEGGGG